MGKHEDIRLGSASLKILRAFLDARSYSASCADLMTTTKLMSGTIYPALARFEEAGWLKSEWEDIDPSKAGRPRRKYYRLTALGQRAARNALEPFAPPGAPQWVH